MRKILIFFRDICILCAVSFVMIFVGNEIINKQNKEILNNADFTIGIVTAFSERFLSSGPSRFIFNYRYKGLKYERSNDEYPSGIKVGQSYLVVVDKDKPDDCLIYWDYPIKDSSDFERTVNKFKQDQKEEEKNKNEEE